MFEETEIPSSSLLPKCLQWMGLTKQEAKSWGLSPGLLLGFQEPNDLNHHSRLLKLSVGVEC